MYINNKNLNPKFLHIHNLSIKTKNTNIQQFYPYSSLCTLIKNLRPDMFHIVYIK